MKPARLILLLVAVIAGGLAAFLATRGQAPAPAQQVAQIQEEPKLQVLVAVDEIGLGQRLNASNVMWQDWPEGAVRPEYITSQVLPDAPEQMEGTVARFEIFAGEPIRTAKLVRSDQGFMSAIIPQGMRGVSIPVTAESGAGGYIVPNDRVDVVHTIDGGDGQVSQTILSNVQVLALGARLGEAGQTGGGSNDESGQVQGQQFGEKSIATLVLNPSQAELIVTAAASGELTLVLRSISDFSEQVDETSSNSSQAIRMVKFGSSSEIQSNTAQLTAASAPAPTNVTPQVTAPIFDFSDPTTTTGAIGNAQQTTPQPVVKQ